MKPRRLGTTASIKLIHATRSVDAAVAEQAIDLLDRVFGHQTACLR